MEHEPVPKMLWHICVYQTTNRIFDRSQLGIGLDNDASLDQNGVTVAGARFIKIDEAANSTAPRLTPERLCDAPEYPGGATFMIRSLSEL
jgi:hypothetical protein